MAKHGWECPRCGRVWAPWVASCESNHDARDVPIKSSNPWRSNRESPELPPLVGGTGRNTFPPLTGPPDYNPQAKWDDPCADRSIE